MRSLLERQFGLAAHGTTVRSEVLAGLTTFLTMAYIVFVQPTLMASVGVDFGAVLVATCLASAVGACAVRFAARYVWLR
jgi:AGZA family xanthine/uracil permease-like MFS transporter